MQLQKLLPRCQRKFAISQRWLVFFLSLTIVGCTTVSNTSLRSPPSSPAKDRAPDASGIVVVPNPYVDDPSLAYAVAEQTKAELLKRGYKIVPSEDQAQLVAIPTVETSFVSAAPETVTPVAPSPAALSPQMDRLGMFTNTLDSLPSFSGPKAGVTAKPGSKVLVIEAFGKDAWDKALIVNELQLAPAWKLRIPLPRELEPAVVGGAVARSGQDTQFVLPH